MNNKQSCFSSLLRSVLAKTGCERSWSQLCLSFMSACVFPAAGVALFCQPACWFIFLVCMYVIYHLPISKAAGSGNNFRALFSWQVARYFNSCCSTSTCTCTPMIGMRKHISLPPGPSVPRVESFFRDQRLTLPLYYDLKRVLQCPAQHLFYFVL